jgi:hypothetical protein
MQGEQLSPPITDTADTYLGIFTSLYRDTRPKSDWKILQTLTDDTIQTLEACIRSNTVHSVRLIDEYLSDLSLGQQESFWEGTALRDLSSLLVNLFLRMSD